MAYLTPPPPRALAHRGLALRAPENTLLAFAHAVEAGATHLETDVRASADGVAVLCHDDSLRRLAGVDRPVAALTLAELQAVPLPGGERLCTLAEALAAFPRSRFNIDIKADDAVLPAARAIREARAEQRVLVTSFSERRRRAAVARLPGVATSAGAPLAALALFAAVLRQRWLVRLALRDVHALQVPPRPARIPVTAPPVLAALHTAGVEVHLWTVNDPDTMRRYLDAGVDGLVTDRVDLAVPLLQPPR